MTYLSDKQVSTRYGVTRTTPWRWVKCGKYPKPVRLSPGCTRWRLADIERWEAEQGQEG